MLSLTKRVYTTRQSWPRPKNRLPAQSEIEMQITKRLIGETVELKVEGRIDGYWADHLAAAVDQEIRQGSHHIQLDLSQVAFLSSVGIGTLVRLYKDLKSIQGSFAVSNCSRVVLKVLELSKLVDLLVAKAPPESLLTNE